MEDILTRLENSSATETDMAELGAAFMDAIKSHADVGWHPMNCPSEIVGDLRNERDELQEEIKRLRDRYEPIADKLSFFYMREDHTFKGLPGTTLDEVLSAADEAESESPYGMLCAVFVLCGSKELRRVGGIAHSYGPNNASAWAQGTSEWRALVEADPDIMRLLPYNK